MYLCSFYSVVTSEDLFNLYFRLDYPTLVSFYDDLFGPLALAKGIPLPPFQEAFYNVSILFINSHPSYAHAMSLPPNVIEIGGFHIKDGPAPPLPQVRPV